MNTQPEHTDLKNEIELFLNEIRKKESPKKKFILDIINGRRGHAQVSQTESTYKKIIYRITIPTWAIDKGITYVKAYGIHELTHCIVGLENKHNKIFKRNEKRLLKKHLNITEIKYKHAYIKSAKFANGQEAW